MSICIKSFLINVLRAAVLPMLLLGVLASASIAQGQLSVSLTQKECLDAMNRARAEHGLYDLKANRHLFRVAQEYAEFMARKKELGHNLDGTTPSEKAHAVGYPQSSFVTEACAYFGGIPAETAPEKIAKDYAESAVATWLASKLGHREQVLTERYRDIGIGFARNGDKAYFCFHAGAMSDETNNPPQVVAGAKEFWLNPPSPDNGPTPDNGLKARDLAGDWDWVGPTSKFKFTLEARDSNLIWKDHTGTHTLTKAAANIFQFSYGAKAKFTSEDAAEFYDIHGNRISTVQRSAPAAIDPAGTWSHLDGSNVFQLTVVADGLIHTKNGVQSKMIKVDGQPNTYQFTDIGITITFTGKDAASISSFFAPIPLKRQ